MAEMDDASRAAAQANFKVQKQQLIDVVECYRQRKYVEDLDYIEEKLNGVQGICEGLDVNIE